MDDFVPRRGWSNPHLQTVRSRIRPIKVQLPPSDEVVVTLPDGSGDRLAVQVHEADPSQPLVIIVHGLGGTAESDYVRFTTAGLLAAGFPVARAHPSAKKPSPRSSKWTVASAFLFDATASASGARPRRKVFNEDIWNSP